jgi:hypothetical protein
VHQVALSAATGAAGLFAGLRLADVMVVWEARHHRVRVALYKGYSLTAVFPLCHLVSSVSTSVFQTASLLLNM